MRGFFYEFYYNLIENSIVSVIVILIGIKTKKSI